MTLYLKYRPQKIEELDLESVRTSLQNILKTKDIPHAFLFSGPKGTGKTSAARILAKIVNCENLGKDLEPCNVCDSCVSITKGSNIDIIELDAASNRGIDDIRNLKENIYLAPIKAKKKVYIIDEVHMLTLEAANAFLKTLEEPPSHVVFILATTNPEKLPATVTSRLTQVNFSKATKKDIERELNRVATGEKIKIESKAIEKITRLADGSFRDAVKILENLIAQKGKNIKEKDIEENESDIKLFFQLLSANKLNEALNFIEELVKEGISIDNFEDEVVDKIHLSILAKNGIGEDYLTNFSLENLILVNDLILSSKKISSPIAQLPFEIALIKYCHSNNSAALLSKAITIETEKENPSKKEQSIDKPTPSDSREKESDKVELKKIDQLDEKLWQNLLSEIKTKNVSIEALLRSGKPIGFDGKVLEIGIYYQFHKDRLEDGKNIKIIEEISCKVFGQDSVKINFNLIDKPKVTKKEEPKDNIRPLTPKVDEDIIDVAEALFGK